MGSVAVGSGFIAVRNNAGFFGIEQRDAFGQFGLRVGRQILGCEATRGVSDRSWAIGFFHHEATSLAKRLAVNPRDGYSPGRRSEYRIVIED